MTNEMNLTPFYRASVGLDRLFDQLTTNTASFASNNYPPHNVLQINDDEFVIELAVAGFGMDNLNITQEKNTLKIEGTTTANTEETDFFYVHKGIAARNFVKEFTLGEHVEVKKASLDLGILRIQLVREVPEEQKPKQITIDFSQ